MQGILDRLAAAYPDAKLALDFTTPLELLIALILAAQCTDERVNQLTSSLLFKKYRRPQDYAHVSSDELEKDIHSTGFYRNKARAIQACCTQLIERFGGDVPRSFDELVSLPGVGRKTANILLGNAFGVSAIGVDTHVGRLAQRLGFSTQSDPDKIEADLTQVVDPAWQIRFCYLIQTHGRRVCAARKPQCGTCVIADLCPYPDKTPPPQPRQPRPSFGRRKEI